jgi:hypothetical protein
MAAFHKSRSSNPLQRTFVHEEGFWEGYRSVARETVHPIALGQAPLLDSDPSAGRQADS